MTFNSIRISLVMLLGLLAGCATLDKDECSSGDWQAFGYKDGTSGFVASNRLASHTKACGKHGVLPDETLYKAGYDAGVLDYCRPENGLEIGENGGEYKGVCPAEVETAFLGDYIAGLAEKLDDLEREDYRLEDELRDETSRYDRMALDGESPYAMKKARARVKSARAAITSHRSEKSKIRNLISKWSRRLS